MFREGANALNYCSIMLLIIVPLLIVCPGKVDGAYE